MVTSVMKPLANHPKKVLVDKLGKKQAIAVQFNGISTYFNHFFRQPRQVGGHGWP